eukprot:1292492-Amorphochlora_amoeboformis.AAC.2
MTTGLRIRGSCSRWRGHFTGTSIGLRKPRSFQIGGGQIKDDKDRKRVVERNADSVSDSKRSHRSSKTPTPGVRSEKGRKTQLILDSTRVSSNDKNDVEEGGADTPYFRLSSTTKDDVEEKELTKLTKIPSKPGTLRFDDGMQRWIERRRTCPENSKGNGVGEARVSHAENVGDMDSAVADDGQDAKTLRRYV